MQPEDLVSEGGVEFREMYLCLSILLPSEGSSCKHGDVVGA